MEEILSSVDSSLSNRDLAPTTREQRTWGFYNYTALWFSMCMEITTYQLASSLIAKGMDWKQAIGTVLLGNLIVLVPMLLNAHAGAKYGIPFPVFIRAPFGVRGANIAAILRAVVACGWFGIQSWIGGTAIHAMLAVIWPMVENNSFVLWTCFLGFWLLNMVVVWRGVESIRRLQAFGAPFDAKLVSLNGRISCCLFSIAYGHGWLLGYAGTEHSGLYALLEIAECAVVGAGVWTARGHGVVYVHRDCCYFGIDSVVWSRHLESD